MLPDPADEAGTMLRVSTLAAVAALAALIPSASFAAEPAPTSAGSGTTAAPAGPSVSVVAATEREIADTVVVTGTLVPRERVLVGVDIEGLKIRELLADQGDEVEAGAVLARLSTDTIEIQLAQNTSQAARAEAAVAQAESQIAEAEAAALEANTALERTRTLQAKGVVSQDQLDQRTAAAASADARLAIARQGAAVAAADRALVESQRREIELRLGKTDIKAPAAGVVLSRSAFIGAVASAQGGALFEIARDGLIELDAEVPETVLPRLAAGQTVTVAPAGAAEPVSGTIRQISPEIDPKTRLGRIRVALPAETDLRSGSFARGTVEITRRTGITVPVAAVVSSGDRSSVQVVRDGVVETRPVRLGLSGDGVVEILEGLSAGETVVSRAGTFLRDGDSVTPIASAPIGGENG